MTSFESLNKAQIGVFGGSGFYKFLDDVEEITVETPFGSPSDRYFVGKIGDKNVAFLPRHGRNHSIPPQKINYRANVWGMKQLGVQQIISPCAAGSLQKEIEPGSFVILDQYIDRTKGREDTFYEGPIATHVSAAEPYSDRLRQLAIKTAKELQIPVYDEGTVVVINGPRFSTKAESIWFTKMGWEIINMTQYPEVHLAKELELETLGIALATDYDCGLEGDVDPVTHEQVIKVFESNLSNLRTFLFELIKVIPDEESCWKNKVIKSSRFL
ncbi:MAG: S-methyl-5'-thioadenosine phosphorylase [Candidatus Caenarcaniphilales bacterium]|nr:S-methyl-5'-thioadenosine phosphorylase [Candidatus Caenarcaniphilales bacterium]